MADNVTWTAGSGTTIATDDVGTVHYQRVKLVDGTLDSSAAIAGDATNGLDVDVTRIADVTATQAVTAAAQAATITVNGQGTAGINVVGTWVATLLFEGSIDGGTTYVAVNAFPINGGAPVTSTAANGQWHAETVGLSHFRVRCSAFTSGTATASVRGSIASGLIGIGEPLPTGTNTIGSIASIGTSVVPGTAATNLGKAEDGAHTSGDVGVMALGVRRSDANSLTALAVDAAYIPLVTDSRGVLQVAPRPRTARVQVTSAGLTTATTAYTIGDQAGTILTVAGAAVATAGTGTLLSVTMLDKGDVGTEYRLHLFSATVTLAADNAAFAVSDADMQNYIGTVMMPTMIDVGANRVSTAANIGLGYSCAATSLFVAIETRAANAIYTAVTDLWLTFHMLMD